MLVTHCLEKEDWTRACEFYLMEDKVDDAWEVAVTHCVMDTFALHLPRGTSAQMHARVALHFKDAGQHGKAADQYKMAGQMVECIMELAAHASHVSQTEQSKILEQAIALVNEAPPTQAKQLARVIMSTVSKDNGEEYAERIFLLNLALGNTHDAISHVADLAISDSKNGQYKVSGRPTDPGPAPEM
jgi:hypothetical protein